MSSLGAPRMAALLASAILAGCGGPSGPHTQPTAERRAPATHQPVAVTSTPATDSSDPAAPAGMGRSPTPMERRIIDDLTRLAADVRELPFVRSVPTEIQDEARIRAFVEGELDRDDIAKAMRVYVPLGMLPADIDLHRVMVDLLGEQIVGYYDTERGRLVVRDDVMRGLTRIGGSSRDAAEARIVLVHELVHALQDQNLALGEMHDLERDSDASNAYRAVVEGDATLAMVAHVLAGQGVDIADVTRQPTLVDRFFGGAATARAGGRELGQAPAIIRVTLISAYTAGALFCADAHRRGGWSAVDNAHRSAPTTSEQVLHPAKYTAGEGADTIAVAGVDALESRGYRVVHRDTLGELEMGVFLALGTDPDRDVQAAAGWAGDRLVVLEQDAGRTAVLWWTTWDDVSEARQAEAAATRAGRSLRDRSVRVVRQGRGVLILVDVPDPVATAQTEAFRTFAAGLGPVFPSAGTAGPTP